MRYVPAQLRRFSGTKPFATTEICSIAMRRVLMTLYMTVYLVYKDPSVSRTQFLLVSSSFSSMHHVAHFLLSLLFQAT